MAETIREWIDDVIERMQLQISEQSRSQLIQYVDLLKEWNKQFNLTRVTDDEGIAVRHIMDSLTLLPYLDQITADTEVGACRSMVDVGTGAGFPGLPIKILRPDWSIVLIDSLSKRIRFLNEVIENLQLQTIRTWHGRAEDAGRNQLFRERFDVATARAVAPLSVLSEYCLPLVQPGGYFLAMKGRIESEWPAGQRSVTLMGGRLERIDTMLLPGTDMNRAILVIRKIEKTPDTYPRKAGRPEKSPL